MYSEVEAPGARPKVYRTRTMLIVAAVLFRGFIGAIATLGSALIAYSEWSDANAKDVSPSWLLVGGTGVMALLFGWWTIGWVFKYCRSFGKTLKLDADGIVLEQRGTSSRYAWDEISRIERDDQLGQHSTDNGIFVALVQHFMGWLTGSTLKVHFDDDRSITLTPFLEKYDEICGRIERKHRRRLQPLSAESDPGRTS